MDLNILKLLLITIELLIFIWILFIITISLPIWILKAYLILIYALFWWHIII